MGAKLRAVIADDSPRARLFVAQSLKNGGWDVVGVAANGKEAIAFCRRLKPDLALLDISMPVMDGMMAAKTIVADKLAAHVLIVSSNIHGGLVDQIEAFGAKVVGKSNDGAHLLLLIAQQYPELGNGS